MPYRYPGTLAAFFTRDAYIFRQQTKAAAGIFPCFAALSLIYSAYDILRQAEVCLNAQSCHGIFYKFCINDLHFLLHQFSLPHNYKQKQSGSQPNSRLVFCIFRAHSARECSVPEGSRPSDARYLFRRLSRRPSALVRQSLRNRFCCALCAIYLEQGSRYLGVGSSISQLKAARHCRTAAISMKGQAMPSQ